jgi:hypothetical protein
MGEPMNTHARTRIFAAASVAALLLMSVLIISANGARSLAASKHAGDHFWALTWVDGVEAEHYESLASMASGVDLIVRGRLSSLSPGRIIGDVKNDNAAYYATAELAVERVVRARPGAAPIAGSVKVEFVTFDDEVVAMMVDAFEPESGIFFLTSKGLSAQRTGEPAAVQAEEAPFYRLAVSYGVIRDVGGRAALRPGTEDTFLRRIEGMRLDEIVNDLQVAS